MKKIFRKFSIICIIFLLCFYISTYWYQVLLIHGQSMYPTYRNWELTLINKQFSCLSAGDVIAFHCPSLDTVLIKRIVAVPGNTVVIRDETLLINSLPCPVVPNDAQISYSGIAADIITLDENEYFVLGDNYEVSKDSRYNEIGIIHLSNIIGKIVPQKQMASFKMKE